MTNHARKSALAVLIAALMLSATALAAAPKIAGTHPRDGGKLVGNVVMFMGYDLVQVGKRPEAKVIDLATKAAVPHTTKGKCKPASRPGAARRCFIEVRLKRWQVGHTYSATVLGKTVRFTIVEGDPGTHPKGRG